MKKYQEAISVDEQVNNLVELGLTIDDENYAKQVLQRVSYYRLIKAYSITLKKDGRYMEGVTFDDIIDLYTFDQELRQLLFSLIENVEVSLRAVITNYFSMKYGNFGYEELSNFGKNMQTHEYVLDKIKKETQRDKSAPFIKNFTDNYEGGKIPFYAVIEVTSFGTLSKMYKNMKSEDKSAIAKAYNVDYHYFESWIENFAYTRNICAHFRRLYGVRITKPPKLYKQYRTHGILNTSIFATILNLKIITEEEQYKEFYFKLISLIDRHRKVDLNQLGFAKNWDELLRP